MLILWMILTDLWSLIWIHKAKPAEDIYKALCDKYGLDRSESIFFDDRSENVEGAVKFGMKSVKILSEQVLLDELDRF